MDCYESLTDACGDSDGLSEEEMEAYYNMLEVCRDIIAWSEMNEPKKETFGNDEDLESMGV
jgi:hypothetical protein